MLTRRAFAALPLLMAASPVLAAPAVPRALKVYKTPTCGCCSGWVTHMRRAGFQPEVINQDDISGHWRRRGVPDELASCHLAEIGGYITIGHVPPADVAKLLKERPKAIGISVPGMPMGSPGMERADGQREAYDTLLLLRGGKTRVFVRHT
jgi:hypothetical protein